MLERTGKFPKRVRFTFSSRIDNLALDVLDTIIEARYTKDKSPALSRANLLLEKLRVLLRISRDERHLDPKGFEHVIRNIDEAGRMVGGWLRSREGGTPTRDRRPADREAR